LTTTTTRKAEEWTIERWRTEPRLVNLEPKEPPVVDTVPLWKDLTIASALAILLWGAVAIVFG